jgi:hypothetical protein
MNGWIKYAIGGLVVLLFLMFNSWKYWERQDKADAMKLEELKHEAVNDSLKIVNMHLQWEVEQLKAVKAEEKINRTNYETNYKKRAEVTSTSSYNDDIIYNRNFITNFKPKYLK